MAEVAQRRIIQLVVDNRELARNTAATVKELEKVNSSVGKIEKSLTFMQTAFKAFLAFQAIKGAVQPLIDIADAVNANAQRLRLVTTSMQELDAIQKGLIETSIRTRSGFAETTEAYVRFTQATERMGVSADQVMKFVQGLALSFKVSGSNAEETSAAMLQLTQAFRSGKFQGDEFRSVSEANSVLMDLLAKELNVTRGELIKMSRDGLIPMGALMNAVLKNTEELQNRFDKMAPTLNDLWHQLQNVTAELAKEFGADTFLAWLGTKIENTLKGVVPLMRILRDYIGDIVRYLSGTTALGKGDLDSLLNLDPSTITTKAQALDLLRQIHDAYGDTLDDIKNQKAEVQKLYDIRAKLITEGVDLPPDMQSKIEAAEELLRSLENAANTLQEKLAAVYKVIDQLDHKPLEITIEKLVPKEKKTKTPKEPKLTGWLGRLQDVEIEPKPADVERLADGWATAGKAFEGYAEKIKQALPQMSDLQKAVEATAKAGADLTAMGNPYGQLIEGLAQVGQGIQEFGKQSENTTESYIKMGVGVSNVLAYISDTAQNLGIENATFMKALAIAQAAVDGALAVIKVLATIPPPYNFAVAGVVAGMVGAQMAVIANQEMPQRRQFGGPVRGGQMYQVGEAGPEIFTDRYGKNYMIPGQAGTVTPNAGTKITVNNYSKAEVKTEESPDGAILVHIIDKAVRATKTSIMTDLTTGQGDMGKVMQRTYGLKRAV